MVTVDEQYPYRLYAPQQDNTTVIVPSMPPQSFGYDSPAQAFTQASGCETGGIMPTPDGKVVWGACKGEVERYDVKSGQIRVDGSTRRTAMATRPTTSSIASRARPSSMFRRTTRTRSIRHRTCCTGRQTKA